MTNEQILEKIGLSGASAELKRASIEGIRQIADKRAMGVIESLMDEEQVTELERRTADGSSLEHNIDWIQRTLSLDVNEIYDASLEGYVNELVEKTSRA